MSVNVEMSEAEFDTFRQFRDKLNDLDAARLRDSLVSVIERYAPPSNRDFEFSTLRNIANDLKKVLDHYIITKGDK